MIDHGPFLPSFGDSGAQADGHRLAAYHLGLSGQDHLADHSSAGAQGREHLQELPMLKIPGFTGFTVKHKAKSTHRSHIYQLSLCYFAVLAV